MYINTLILIKILRFENTDGGTPEGKTVKLKSYLMDSNCLM